MNSRQSTSQFHVLISKLLFKLIVLGLVFISQISAAQTQDELIVVGQRFTMHSNILNETRAYSVYLPASYRRSPNKKYMVAYVLDGERSKFLEVTGIVQSMHSSMDLKLQIPELIVVSIENTDRYRDFAPTNSLNYLDREDIIAQKSSGKANEFMKFIEDELMAKINSTYRTLDKNLIIGHSLGGLFTLHCLLENPDMFSYYLLIDPSWFWDHNYIGKRGREILENKTDLKARVFIALANNFHEDPRHYQWGEEFYELLKANPSPDLSVAFQYFEDEKHLTVPIPATYFGLRYLFKPYEIDLNQVTEDPSILFDYEERTRKELFIGLKPDEGFVNTMGYVALYPRQIPDVAVTLFELNAKNYPTSLNVWDSLAEAYTVKGYLDKAKECYEKILELSPTNERAKKKLEELTKSL